MTWGRFCLQWRRVAYQGSGAPIGRELLRVLEVANSATITEPKS